MTIGPKQVGIDVRRLQGDRRVNPVHHNGAIDVDSIGPFSFAETSGQTLLKALLASDLFDGLEVL